MVTMAAYHFFSLFLDRPASADLSFILFHSFLTLNHKTFTFHLNIIAGEDWIYPMPAAATVGKTSSVPENYFQYFQFATDWCDCLQFFFLIVGGSLSSRKQSANKNLTRSQPFSSGSFSFIDLNAKFNGAKQTF